MVCQFFSLNHHSFSPVYLTRYRPYFFESLFCGQNSDCFLLEFDKRMTYIESFVHSCHCVRSYECTHFCPHVWFESVGPRSDTFDYPLSSHQPTQVRNHTISSRRQNKNHVLFVLFPVADKTMHNGLAVVEGIRCSSLSAVSTKSAENTSSNSSRNGNVSVLFCSLSSRPAECTCINISRYQ
jgi:hypothetical protein